MLKFLKKLEAFAKSPIVELVVGGVLVATGLIEAGESIFEDVTAGDLALHHGVIVLGIVHALKALPGVAAGLTLLIDGGRRHEP